MGTVSELGFRWKVALSFKFSFLDGLLCFEYVPVSHEMYGVASEMLHLENTHWHGVVYCFIFDRVRIRFEF